MPGCTSAISTPAAVIEIPIGRRIVDLDHDCVTIADGGLEALGDTDAPLLELLLSLVETGGIHKRGYKAKTIRDSDALYTRDVRTVGCLESRPIRATFSSFMRAG